jgi:N-acetylglucosamine-6-phosphate deacetylase
MLLIKGKRVVVSPAVVLEPGFVTVADGCIVAASQFRPTDVAPGTPELEADLVVPGFVDIHTHGIGGNQELVKFWLNPEYTLTRVVKYGTTSVIGTMVIPRRGSNQADMPQTLNPFQPSCMEDMCTCGICFASDIDINVPMVSKKLNATVGKLSPKSAVLEGIHAEGPVVATLGGLPEGQPDMPMADFVELLNVLGPGLKLMTISPSVDAVNGFEKIQLLVERGVKPALGHDKECSVDDIIGALKFSSPAAPFHITHAFNVQTLHHRDMGLGNFALAPKFPALPEYRDIAGCVPTMELIGDCAHVDALLLQAALAARSECGGLCFVTDGSAEPIEGLEFLLTGRTAKVVMKNGIPRVELATESGSVLAGSSIMMLDAFRTAVQILGADVGRAVDMCSTTPAKIAGLPHVGTLECGMRADLVLLSDSLNVQHTVVAGAIAHDADIAASSHGGTVPAQHRGLGAGGSRL